MRTNQVSRMLAVKQDCLQQVYNVNDACINIPHVAFASPTLQPFSVRHSLTSELPAARCIAPSTTPHHTMYSQ